MFASHKYLTQVTSRTHNCSARAFFFLIPRVCVLSCCHCRWSCALIYGGWREEKQRKHIWTPKLFGRQLTRFLILTKNKRTHFQNETEKSAHLRWGWESCCLHLISLSVCKHLIHLIFIYLFPPSTRQRSERERLKSFLFSFRIPFFC